MKKKKTQEVDADRTRNILLGVGLVGFGLLAAAAVGLVVVNKRNVLKDPDYDSLLGIGA